MKVSIRWKNHFPILCSGPGATLLNLTKSCFSVKWANGKVIAYLLIRHHLNINLFEVVLFSMKFENWIVMLKFPFERRLRYNRRWWRKLSSLAHAHAG